MGIFHFNSGRIRGKETEKLPEITKKEILGEIIERFKKAGYGLNSTIIDASLCGVPQLRKRYVLIGCLGAEDDFLQTFLEENYLILVLLFLLLGLLLSFI